MGSLAFGCTETHFVTVWIRSLCNTDLPSLSPSGSTCSNVICQFYWHRFLTWQLLPHTLSLTVSSCPSCVKPLLTSCFSSLNLCWSFHTAPGAGPSLPLSEQELIPGKFSTSCRFTVTDTLQVPHLLCWWNSLHEKVPLHRWPGWKKYTSNSCPKPTHHESKTSIYNLCS